MIWNEAKECMSRDELMTIQGKRLVRLVKRVYHSVEYYRRKMQQEGIEPGDIRGIEDLEKLPFTTREDLIQNCPFDFLAVPQSEIIRYHSSNATTGTEIMTGCTRNDIELWTECVARCIYMAGLGKNDTLQIAYNYEFLSGGLEAYCGAQKVGTAVIPSIMCGMDKMIRMMKEMHVTGIMCMPSYLWRIGQVIEGMGEYGRLELKTAMCSAEPWSERMRQDIENMLNIKTHDIYGFSELAGLGVACECEYHEGLHVQEDFFITEILDKDTGIAVKDGEKGELVYTTLCREGTPLLRYKTGDLTTITRERCRCGRTNARIGRLESRTDDIIIIRGVSVFRLQIENMFAELEDIHAKYLMRIYKEANLDMVDVTIELDKTQGIFLTEMEKLVKIRVEKAVKSTIGIMPKVHIADMGELQRASGKNSMIIDDRRRK